MGDRIRARRQLRGWSIRQAAARAGISHTSWSRIERGRQRTDRYLVVDLAAALECSVTELTGQPYTSADRRLETSRINAIRVWRAMMAHPIEAVRGDVAPDGLDAEVDLVRDLYRRCDYAGVLQRLHHLIPHLHAARDVRRARTKMVAIYGVAMGALLNVGFPAEAWLAAERSAAAAESLDDPVARGVAAANRARVAAYSGAFGPARSICDAAAADLEHHRAAAAPDVLGFLHLARGHHAAGLHDLPAAEDHLAEAASIADRTGETSAWDLEWGPRNVALWRMALLLDTGRPGAAAEIAARTPITGLPPVRQVYYWLDSARAMVGAGRDRDAVRMLLAAERTGEQHTRASTAARETARDLLRRGSPGSELRGLCERLGVAA
ncbi:helix-turn-helix transcriptional regulator [Solwaraspora sp. WMMD1047]|uniref:helix-turn-helix domain-containing protein n=1 Tax=Solwaraspora sp. WMMD1047 TaxID=3016102 RepID=UPI002416E51D|nr:helix-turn-helix transcriptional regulator [Solwaraspora sp. WMMD1047]MDG4831230.1 helix-turn-helix transcriptional regulator [Solwaraspora sp. WMMD1047]